MLVKKNKKILLPSITLKTSTTQNIEILDKEVVEVDSESESVITNKEQSREKDDEKKPTVFYLNNTVTKKEYHW
jgi:hypothetical protein